MITWAYRPFGCKHIAYRTLGEHSGYIPFSPYSGRHIMDDFGNLVKAYPNRFYFGE